MVSWWPFGWWPFSQPVQPSSNTYPLNSMSNASTIAGSSPIDPVTKRRLQSSLVGDPSSPDFKTWEGLPWKYAGYPLFTRYLASSQEAFIIRRFDQLHSRVILKMQDDIVQIEEQINGIDLDLTVALKPTDGLYNNGSFRADAEATGTNSPFLKRSQLLNNLQFRLKEYDEMILNYRTLRADPEPPRSEVRNIVKFLGNLGYSREDPNKGPIRQEEAEYIHQEGDLVQLVPYAKPMLRRIMEKWTGFMLGFWFTTQPKGTQHYQDYRSSKQVVYQSEARISGFITGISLLTGLALIIAPLQVLNKELSEQTKLNIICILISVFLVVLALIMPARPWETLGATAAYAAVLMVFLQVTSQIKNPLPSAPGQ